MFFDCTCPFAWATSRWLKEVEKVRDISVGWTPMSLSVLNEGRELEPAYRAKMDAAWAPARVAAALAVEAPEKVDAYYTAMGTAIHTEARLTTEEKTDPHAYDALIAEALEAAGADALLAEAAHKPQGEEGSYEQQLRDFQDRAVQLVGNDVGTPVVQLGDVAFFGPVITRIPKGEEAGKMFDAAVTLAEFPYFFEMKRSRSEMPKFD